MRESQRFELNNPPVVAELVEGEAIAINLKSGCYYSLTGPAAMLWARLLDGSSPAEILAAVSGGDAADEARAGLWQFVDNLLAEELIRPAANRMPETAARPLNPWAKGALRLERFTDMQDMLTLDPIHEIDSEFGWPRPLG
jgi:hypothetical protein